MHNDTPDEIVAVKLQNNSIGSDARPENGSLWALLWSCAATNGSTAAHITPLTKQSDREEIRWALDLRIADIEARKKDHWLYAYTSLAALGALALFQARRGLVIPKDA